MEFRREGINELVAHDGFQPVIGKGAIADLPDGAHVSPNALGAHQLDEADLSGAGAVHPAAGDTVEAVYLNDANLTLKGRWPTETERFGLSAVRLECRHRAILTYHCIGRLFRFLKVGVGYLSGGEFHGGVVGPLVNGHRLMPADAEHGGRDDVLSGMLLHVVSSRGLIDPPLDPFRLGRGVDEMQDTTVALLYVEHPAAFEIAAVGRLPAPFGIEAGSIELHPDGTVRGRARGGLGGEHASLESSPMRVFVIELLRHPP